MRQGLFQSMELESERAGESLFQMTRLAKPFEEVNAFFLPLCAALRTETSRKGALHIAQTLANLGDPRAKPTLEQFRDKVFSSGMQNEMRHRMEEEANRMILGPLARTSPEQRAINNQDLTESQTVMAAIEKLTLTGIRGEAEKVSQEIEAGFEKMHDGWNLSK